MSEQDNIQVVKDSIAAFSRGDAEGEVAFFADNCEQFEAATGRRTRGKAEALALSKGWLAACPDANGTVTNAFASGEQVAVEITYRGTNNGPLETPAGTIPPTGKRAELQSAYLCKVRDGKIQVATLYFDMASLMQQLGISG